jgi:hypothetical protein
MLRNGAITFRDLIGKLGVLRIERSKCGRARKSGGRFIPRALLAVDFPGPKTRSNRPIQATLWAWTMVPRAGVVEGHKRPAASRLKFAKIATWNDTNARTDLIIGVLSAHRAG